MLVRKENKIIRKPQKESFDGYREIESEEDILDLLSDDVRDELERLPAKRREYAFDLLSQRVDWCTEDEDEIDSCMQDILRFEI